ncbi:MAG: helix-turn-helix domain-containing protein [Verrucomicrobiota bacterium JB024]|nr:helix-turn-helix domain-containing protein [Verrucomicrobiota bacterium JB024]
MLNRKSFFGQRRARVMINRMPQQADYQLHRHEFCEIVVVLSGKAIHVTGSFRRQIGAGDVMVINSRRSHGYERTCGLNLVNIHIHREVMLRLERQLRDIPGFDELIDTRSARWRKPNGRERIQLTDTELEQVNEWIARMEDELRYDTAENALIAEAYLTLIVGLIARSFRKGRQSAVRAEKPDRAPVDAVASWIAKNLDKPVCVSDMAQRAGMSERTFYREFRARFGMSPVAYVLRSRIHRARDLLHDSKGKRLRVCEVALACGFTDSNYFSTCFRRQVGCSPRAFAKAGSDRRR